MSDEQNVDIMQMNPLEMSEEQIMQRYSTKTEAPQWELSQEARDYIGRVKRENPGMDEATLMTRALRNGMQDMQRQQQPHQRGGIGKSKGPAINGLGFGGTGSRSRSFSSMNGAKK